MKTYPVDSFTYGAELEWSDFARVQLPDGWKYDERDFTMVNSNGIAVDPKGISYGWGGEINMPPRSRPYELTDEFVFIYDWLRDKGPAPTVNYRSNLHVHVGVPGLVGDLAAVKRLQAYCSVYLPLMLGILEPLPRPEAKDFPGPGAYEGALRRWRRRRVSHQTVVPRARVELQMGATTLDEFFELEVPHTKAGNKPMWHAAPRAAVNIRQLRETGTIEFRHFPGTTDPARFQRAVDWCRMFMDAALNTGESAVELLNRFTSSQLPPFPKYDHEMERMYRLTVHDGTLSRAAIENNIQVLTSGFGELITPKEPS